MHSLIGAPAYSHWYNHDACNHPHQLGELHSGVCRFICFGEAEIAGAARPSLSHLYPFTSGKYSSRLYSLVQVSLADNCSFSRAN